jgi:hypothetical protein
VGERGLLIGVAEQERAQVAGCRRRREALEARLLGTDLADRDRQLAHHAPRLAAGQGAVTRTRRVPKTPWPRGSRRAPEAAPAYAGTRVSKS